MSENINFYLLGVLNDLPSNTLFAASEFMAPGKSVIIFLVFYLTELIMLPINPLIITKTSLPTLVYFRCIVSLIPATILTVVSESIFLKSIAIFIQTAVYCFSQVALLKIAKKFSRTASRCYVAGLGLSLVVGGVIGLIMSFLYDYEGFKLNYLFSIFFVILTFVFLIFYFTIKNKFVGNKFVGKNRISSNNRSKDSDEYSQTASYSMSIFGDSGSSMGEESKINTLYGNDDNEEISVSVSVGSLGNKTTKIPQLEIANRRKNSMEDNYAPRLSLDKNKSKTLLSTFRLNIILIFVMNFITGQNFTALMTGLVTDRLSKYAKKDFQYSLYFLSYTVGTWISRSLALVFNYRNIKMLVFGLLITVWGVIICFRIFFDKVMRIFGMGTFFLILAGFFGYGFLEGVLYSAIFSGKSGTNRRSNKEARYLMTFYLGGVVSSMLSFFFLTDLFKLKN